MEQAKNYSSYILPVAGVLVLGAVAQKFGLIPSAESQKNKEKAGDTENYLSREYLEQLLKKAAPGTRTKLLTQKDAETFARAIEGTKHLLKNDRVKLVSLFKRIPYRSQVAQVADKFYKLFGNDLFVWLRDNYNDEILAAIHDAINKKQLGQ